MNSDKTLQQQQQQQQKIRIYTDYSSKCFTNVILNHSFGVHHYRFKDFALFFISARHCPRVLSKNPNVYASETDADKKENHTKMPLLLHNMTPFECQNIVLLFLCYI